MSEIINLSDIKAKEYAKRSNRLVELERLIHVCLVSYQSLLDINDPLRFRFTAMINTYRNIWEKERERIKADLARLIP